MSMLPAISTGPDALGRFGEFGGRYVPETLMHPVEELGRAWEQARRDAGFQAEYERLLKDFAGRPTALFEARRLSELLGGARIFLKREDLLHTGAHKINNALGQGLLAKRMGKQRIIAETGAGQHGVATATACAVSVSSANTPTAITVGGSLATISAAGAGARYRGDRG